MESVRHPYQAGACHSTDSSLCCCVIPTCSSRQHIPPHQTHCTALHVAGRAFSSCFWSNGFHMLYCCHRTKSFWSTSALCGLSSAARCWQTYVRMCIVVTNLCTDSALLSVTWYPLIYLHRVFIWSPLRGSFVRSLHDHVAGETEARRLDVWSIFLHIDGKSSLQPLLMATASIGHNPLLLFCL